jgi:microcystin-dependent protein
MSVETRNERQDADIVQDSVSVSYAVATEGDNLGHASSNATLQKIYDFVFGLSALIGEKLRRRNATKFNGADIAMTGNITSNGTLVTGSGTAFLDPVLGLKNGDWIAGSANEYREVLSIGSDTELTLVERFPTNISPAQPFKRIQTLAERLDGFSAAKGVIVGGVEKQSNNPPTILSGSYHVSTGTISLSTNVVNVWTINFGDGQPSDYNWYALLLNNQGQAKCHIIPGSSIVASLTISSISNTVGPTWKYSFSGSPDLSGVAAGDVLYAFGCNTASNNGIFPVSAVDNVLKWIEVTNTNGAAQPGAAGTGEALYSTGDISGGGSGVELAAPQLTFNAVANGYYSDYFTDQRVLAVFYIDAGGQITRIYELGNGRNWKGCENSEIGSTSDLWFEHEPPYAYFTDGGLLTVANNKALFDKIGYAYGGSGANFNLPDIRGRVTRCMDAGAGIDPDAGSRTDRGDGVTGDAVGTLQGHAYNSHSHGLTDNNHLHSELTTGGSGGALAVGVGFANITVPSGGPTANGYTVQSAGGNETRMVNINVYKVMFAGYRK